ncbi:MAG: YigZ family protein [Ruminococcaceae bacterium]|nr:YigZ family protein [Oscillospiraceae bacterium]
MEGSRNLAYVTVAREAKAELEIKKSVFIAHIAHVESEEEAMDFVNAIKSEHRDARHNVWAYLLNGGATARMSDDGEPQGTGGVPVLDVIKKGGFTDAVIVVTRYFGGILLGAGGLIRAYSGAARLAVEEAGLASFVPYTVFSVKVSYSDHGKIENDYKKYGVLCDGTEYSDSVLLNLAVKSENYEKYSEYIKELGNGKYECSVKGTRYGAV